MWRAGGRQALCSMRLEREREMGPQLRLLETRSRGSPRRTHSQAKTDNRVVIYCPVR